MFTVAIPDPDDVRGAVALTGGDPSWMNTAWFPWKTSDSGEILIHMSSIPAAFKLGMVDGFTPEARALWKTYAAECKRSYMPDKIVPDGVYPWLKLFTSEYKHRAYQLAGMDRLYARAMLVGRGSILGDDVGLGKTPMAIGTAERIRREKGWPVRVVTTLSTLSQWKDEVERFAKLKPVVVMAHGEGAERERRLKLPHDWLLMSYETVRMPRFMHLIRKLPPGVLILDEAFKAANPKTATHAEVSKLAERSMAVLPFNATPLENSLVDVYGQLRLIDKSIMGGLSGFSSRYLVMDGEKIVGVKRIREFRVRAAAAMLRRSASECGAEVPKVVAEVRECPMGAEQGRAYMEAIGAFLSDRSTGAVVRTKIAKARYAAFALDMDNPASPSSKMEELESLLANELSGQRVIVISRFVRVIEFAAMRLRRLKPWVIHGDTPQTERGDIRRRFNSRLGRGRVLLGTEAIERGLNLQSAGVLVNLDLPWNAARLRQRVGRIARIGQTRERVLVLNLSATLRKHRTVDDWLVKVVAMKRGIFDAVYGDDGTDELGNDKDMGIEAMRAYLSQ